MKVVVYSAIKQLVEAVKLKDKAQINDFYNMVLFLLAREREGELAAQADHSGDDIVSDDLHCLLRIAIHRDAADEAAIWLDMGASLDECNHDGQTPLHQAVGYCVHQKTLRGRDCIQLFLKRGANPNYQNEKNSTPFCYAVLSGFEAIVLDFAPYQVDVNVINAHTKSTVLFNATLLNHILIMTILLNMGADTELKNLQGLTPLHAACIQGRLSVVIELLRYEADIDALDSQSKSPLQMAKDLPDQTIFNLLTLVKSLREFRQSFKPGSTLPFFKEGASAYQAGNQAVEALLDVALGLQAPEAILPYQSVITSNTALNELYSQLNDFLMAAPKATTSVLSMA